MSALRLQPRLRRAMQALAYLAVSVPLAILGALAVVALLLGAALSVLGIGLPLLLAAEAAARALARADRRAANRFLGAHIPPVAEGVSHSGGPWRRSLRALSDRSLWRVVALLAAKPILVAGMLIVALAPLALLVEVIALAVQGIGGVGDVEFIGPFSLGIGLGLALAVFAVPVMVLVVAVLDGLYTVLCTLVRPLLAPRALPEGPVRELLAESLGDRSLSIAYWLPDKEIFVDEAGHPVDLPDRLSGRAWTAVERDGQRVAAIVHDAALDTGPELVNAAAAAASLAIDNERLKADLRARLEELRVSRLRIVAAGDEARRRLERDLHDGAQQQLVSLLLDLRLLKAKLKDDPAAIAEIDQLAHKLDGALAELRELARGIHPAMLTERGLEPAIESLAQRVPVPVTTEVRLDVRPRQAHEAAAYFVVAEALTNVARYAQATAAAVEVHAEGAALVVTVSDDGVGGAQVGAGSGLRGLADRVAALDGTLSFSSPPGEGTVLTARLPGAIAHAAPAAGAVRDPELDEQRA